MGKGMFNKGDLSRNKQFVGGEVMTLVSIMGSRVAKERCAILSKWVSDETRLRMEISCLELVWGGD